ncbi:MAG: MAPEG family protein, partial [Pseudomonadota bacterium]
GWALGPQDEKREPNLVAGRLERALTNYVYNLPAFLALALALTVTNLNTETTAMGAALWFWARVAYVPAYASGLPLVRSIAWFASLAGLALMIMGMFGTPPAPDLLIPATD